MTCDVCRVTCEREKLHCGRGDGFAVVVVVAAAAAAAAADIKANTRPSPHPGHPSPWISYRVRLCSC